MAERYRPILHSAAVLAVLAAVCIYWNMAVTDRVGSGALVPEAYALQGGSYTMDLNTADKELLMALPGIGEELAGRIVEYRQTCGDFDSVEELMNVYGIGEKTVERVAPFLTVSRSSP